MTNEEYCEYAIKSGLTPQTLQDALRGLSGRSRLWVHQKLYHYAKAVCWEAFGTDFASRVQPTIDIKKALNKYEWMVK